MRSFGKKDRHDFVLIIGPKIGNMAARNESGPFPNQFRHSGDLAKTGPKRLIGSLPCLISKKEEYVLREMSLRGHGF